jgi:hypothetical protein
MKRTSLYGILIALVAVLFMIGLTALVQGDSPGASKASVFRQKANRIVQLRAHNTPVSKDDYLLMGCDNSCARRNHPQVPEDELREFIWMAGGEDLSEREAGYNAEATQDAKTGKWHIDRFLNDCTKSKYQASPEEVAWHYLRVVELRAKGIPRDERIATMTAEAKGKPWLKLK